MQRQLRERIKPLIHKARGGAEVEYEISEQGHS